MLFCYQLKCVSLVYCLYLFPIQILIYIQILLNLMYFIDISIKLLYCYLTTFNI